MTQNRIGDWFLSISGAKIYPLDLHPGDIRLEDIAHSLSNICRFGGHCKEFYSVAQHSVYVSRVVSKANRLVALLHDATEAYCGDMVRPLKQSLPEYIAAEERIWAVIAEKFGLPVDLPDEVKRADAAVLLSEKERLLNSSGHVWGFPQCAFPGITRANIAVVPWWPTEAKKEFIRRFEAYSRSPTREVV